MVASTLVSLEEYLRTTYRPDCDYVDGAVLERNVGQRDHAYLQSRIPIWFWKNRQTLRLVALTEQRMQVAPGRFRVPDVCVVGIPMPNESVFTSPPCIVIEVLSPDDSFASLQTKLDDYLDMGVPNVWVMDPATRRPWQVTKQGHFEALDGMLRSTDSAVALPVSELFDSSDL